MKRPGDSRMERLATCAACLFGKGTDLTNLDYAAISILYCITLGRKHILPTQRVYKNKFCQNDSCSLEVHGLPRIIAQVLHDQHRRVHICGCLRHQPFKGRKERRVIECPFRGFLNQPQSAPTLDQHAFERTHLVVPFLNRKGVGNGEPVPMNLKVRGLTIINRKISISSTRTLKLRRDGGTHYAGKSRTLNAAATMAHCVSVGYSSVIGAIAHNNATKLGTDRERTRKGQSLKLPPHIARDLMRRSNQKGNRRTDINTLRHREHFPHGLHGRRNPPYPSQQCTASSFL